MQTYFLVDDGVHMPRWSVLSRDEDGSFWIDFKARRIPYADGRPLAHVESENIMATVNGVPEAVAELERSFAFERLLDPWSDQGWIAPDGKFWGCSYYAHDDLAYALIRKHPAALEHEGWVRVHTDSFRTGDGLRRITRRQEATLHALGFPDIEQVWIGRRAYEADRSLPPPRHAVRPPPGIPRAVIKAPQARDNVADALTLLARRLSECPSLAARFAVPYEPIPDVGPGTWMWMLRWDDMDIGGEDHAEALLASEGLLLRATSWNTVEVQPWPFPGIRVDPDAASIVDLAPVRRYG